MKVSDLLKFADEIAASVSVLVKELDDKFADAYSSLVKEVKDIRKVISESASAASVDELRAAINLSAESLRDEIELKATVSPTEIKSISCEGKSLVVALSDGREETFELPVIEGKDGVDGQAGKDGLDGTNGENGKDGENGRDGVDGQSGRDGVDGKDGENGKDGKDGVGLKSVEAKAGVVTFISTAGEEYTVELPKPEAPALPAAPRDPTDITDAMVDRDGDLTLVFSNGTTKNVGKIVGRDGVDGIHGRDGVDGAQGIAGERGPAGLDGRDGIDGKDGVDGANGLDGRNGVDGRDGFGFEDMNVELLDDGRTVNFKFVRGDDVKEFPIKFPVMLYQKGYQSDRVYYQGDVVSFGGSTYHADAEVVGEVPGVSPNWTQQTAAGLRGSRGERGIAGKDGKNGVNGKDLRTF